MSDDPTVVPLFPNQENSAGRPRPLGAQILAGLLILVQGAVQIARVGAMTALWLLAAVGLLTLLGVR